MRACTPQLADPVAYDLRRVGRFRVVGRSAAVTVWEAFDEDEPDACSAKRATMTTHDAALAAFEAGRIDDACRGFEEVARAQFRVTRSPRATSRVLATSSIVVCPRAGTAS